MCVTKLSDKPLCGNKLPIKNYTTKTKLNDIKQTYVHSCAVINSQREVVQHKRSEMTSGKLCPFMCEHQPC